MKYMDIGCNINCWECEKRCDFKVILKVSIFLPHLEKTVYAEIMNKLKAQAVSLTCQGKNKQDVDEDLKILAVSFYVARLKLKEQLIPENQN